MNARADLQIGLVISAHAGKIAPLGDSGRPSAFIKAAVAGPVAVGRLGLDGDEQADRRLHGGLDKAVYAYDNGCYGAWSAEFPHLRFGPGSMGENVAMTGFDETTVSVGDVHRIGSVLLQACQPRQPCWKLAAVFDEPQVVKAMLVNGLSGWYYRVLETGVIVAGDAVELVDRGSELWTIRRLANFTVARHRPRAEVNEVIQLAGVAEGLRDRARTWLAAT